MSEAYYKSPLSSSGNAGRWNPKGVRMIYAAGSPSLALLEYLCIRGTAVAGKPWYMMVFEIKDEKWIGELQSDSLPTDWNLLPHGKTTQDFGKSWLREQSFPFLKVPSARIPIEFYPNECNLLINPDFPSLSKYLKFKEAISFGYLLNKGG